MCRFAFRSLARYWPRAAPGPSVGTDGSISQVAAVAITVTQPADRRAKVGLQRSQISPHSRATGRKDARVVSYSLARSVSK